VGALIQELFRASLYKRTQGKIARQVSAAMLGVLFGVGAWCLSEEFSGNYSKWIVYGVPTLLLAFGAWLSYRLVNWPPFADFLISVEAEMNKVSWPGRGELFRSSVVVIAVMFILAAVLYLYDLIWNRLLILLNVIG